MVTGNLTSCPLNVSGDAPATAAPPSPGPRNGLVLAAVGICKTFTGLTRPVLDRVSLLVPQGQRLALIGANGAGKSTLLRCCLRLIEPDAGSIHLFGEDLTRMRRAALRRQRARVGLVFQKHHLVPTLSALSNVLHGALGSGGGPRRWLHSMARRNERERAMECLEQVGLANAACRAVRLLSGGQAQRVAIARMLMQQPQLLCADEPAASLDPAAGQEVMRHFAALSARRGLALIVVSHHLEHALEHAERVVALAAGRVVLDSPTARLSLSDLQGLYA